MLFPVCFPAHKAAFEKGYICTWCQGTAGLLDSWPQSEVQVGPDKLEVVPSFCYLGDMRSAASGIPVVDRGTVVD